MPTTRRPLLPLLLALAAASCQATTPGKPPVGPAPAASATPRPAARSAAPATGGDASPAAPPSTTAAPAKLLAPAGDAVALTGRVLLDERYATTRGGAARLLGADGGTLIGMDGATLVGADGGTLVAGGRIVAAGAGNVIAPAELAGGSTLIGADGGSLIGNDGGSLIGADGGSLIGNDGTYRLAQADAAAFGAPAPAAGMWVSVVDARDGLTKPLGKDAAGQDVYTVYTDARGGFAVHVDPALAPHLRVVARAPGRRDPRLTLSVITSAGAGERRIDEQEAAAAGFLRTVCARRMAGYFGLVEGDAGSRPDPVAAGIVAALGPVKAELEKIKAGPNGAANLHEVCLLLADRMILTTGYENLTLGAGEGLVASSGLHPESASLAGKPAIAELRGVIARVTERARVLAAGDLQDGGRPRRPGMAGSGQADPAAYFAAKPWMIAANLGRAPADQYAIERPTDMIDFLGRAYLSAARPGEDDKYNDVASDLGLSLLDRDRVEMVAPALFQALFTAIAAEEDSEAATAELAALVRATGERLAKAPARPSPAPGRTAPPVVEPPAEPVRAVTTIAGHPGEPGAGRPDAFGDGPGAGAWFSLPNGLALDEAHGPAVLYVADSLANAIRRITFDGAGQATVATIAATNGKVVLPRGLTLDARGDLYVVSYGDHKVLKVTDPRGDAATLTTIAGSEKGFRDGPGAEARFDALNDVAVAPDGALLVTDALNARIRRIAVGEPGFPVTTFLGTGAAVDAEGPRLGPAPAIPGAETQGHPGARPDLPHDVAFGPDGALYFTEFNRSRIYRVDPPLEPTSWVRLFAGGKSIFGRDDGYYHDAGFAQLDGFAFDAAGRIVIAEPSGHRVRVVTPDRWVRTIAGSGPRDVELGGWQDGPSDQARFNRPVDVAIAKDGTIYVADSRNHVIRRIAP